MQDVGMDVDSPLIIPAKAHVSVFCILCGTRTAAFENCGRITVVVASSWRGDTSAAGPPWPPRHRRVGEAPDVRRKIYKKGAPATSTDMYGPRSQA